MNSAIMLVDVASPNREGLKSFLQNQKYHVDKATDGVSAVRRFKPGPLDAEERRIMQEHPIIGLRASQVASQNPPSDPASS